ncbi:hypothetical protein AZI86_01295 [Bdellovibrio bacteriovorus]|uniref:Methyltransferase domain-containing protein n=1 Tax=Bdellovibrio bacteriovorus TaxID=959 RepID=A0A150WN68_BDEBC|nr:class I SAM-dependent methyltransferase [Bdellovibrio bacteriovorus]KYG65739.1 hypothetical protein AZI86_01295 [Bdellovibrio bacteriovorus]
MKTQYRHYTHSPARKIQRPPVINTMSHILSLGALDERGCVDHLQKVIGRFYEESHDQTPPYRALDLNSGRGVAAMALAEMGFRVAALDVFRSSISVVRKLAQKEDLNISLRVGDPLHIHELHEQFELIHDRECFTQMTNTEERKQFLKSVKESLAQNGKFVLVTNVLTAEFNPQETFESVTLDQDYILWRQTPESDVEGVVQMEGKSWTASQKLAPAERIRRELLDAGFEILSDELEIVPGQCRGVIKLVLTKAA